MAGGLSLKRKRSSSPERCAEAKRKAVTTWLSDIEVPMSLAQASAVEALMASDPTSSLASQSQSTRTRSRRRQSEGDSSIITITRDMPDFAPRLESCNVKNADAQIHQPKPDNWPELQKILRQARETPEALEQDQKDARFYLHRSINEQTAFGHIRDLLLKKEWTHDPNASNQADALWMRHVPIEPNDSFRFPDPKPDLTYGWAISAFAHWPIERLLHAQTLKEPRLGLKRSYCAPHPQIWWPFATVEAKGPAGTFAECHLQNQHSAAVMLNNRFHLKRTSGAALPYGQAFIFSVDMITTASLNCHWVSKDSHGKDVFWTKQLASWDLLSMERNTLNTARQAIRNCIEYARRASFDDIRIELQRLQARYPTVLTVDKALKAIHEQQASAAVPEAQSGKSSAGPLETAHDTPSAITSSQNQDTPPTPTSIQALQPSRIDHQPSEAGSSSSRARKPTPSMDATAHASHRSKK